MKLDTKLEKQTDSGNSYFVFILEDLWNTPKWHTFMSPDPNNPHPNIRLEVFEEYGDAVNFVNNYTYNA